MEHGKFFYDFLGRFQVSPSPMNKDLSRANKDYPQWNALKLRVSLIIGYNVLIDRFTTFISIHNWKISARELLLLFVDYGYVVLRFKSRLWNTLRRWTFWELAIGKICVEIQLCMYLTSRGQTHIQCDRQLSWILSVYLLQSKSFKSSFKVDFDSASMVDEN